ncbi:MAG TPA: DUF3179 domain-containing protein [bacterium]|nr:DUF3179 domain-containing protein [bacterium]
MGVATRAWKTHGVLGVILLVLASTPAMGAGVDAAQWKTEFSKHAVPLDEIQPGGPPKDGIPAIDHPRFIAPRDAGWLADREPVVLVEHRGVARAYPLEILVWHEIVNDIVAGDPVVITFCPLCHTALAFRRTLDGLVYDFGTTGFLRKSDLVMYDRQTESWWQQAEGVAIVGRLTGRRLEPVPAQLVAWRTFREAYPKGAVLSRETGFRRAYGQNPYVDYDALDNHPFLFRGAVDRRLRAMERVVAVSLGGETAAYAYPDLARVFVAQDTVGGRAIVVFWAPGVSSALGAGTIARGADVGTSGVFVPSAAGRRLGFHAVAPEDGSPGRWFVDDQTRSRWDILGRAVDGPLSGSRLAPIVHGDYFWFAWAAFQPGTRVWRP